MMQIQKPTSRQLNDQKAKEIKLKTCITLHTKTLKLWNTNAAAKSILTCMTSMMQQAKEKYPPQLRAYIVLSQERLLCVSQL